MGLFETLIKESTKKVVANVAGNTIEKVAGKTIDAVSEYNKNHIQKEYCSVPFSSDDYDFKNYKVVMEELSAYGFTNIVLLPHRDLINGWLTKDGTVENISINGKEKFRKNTKFKSDVRIVITYHTFKNK